MKRSMYFMLPLCPCTMAINVYIGNMYVRHNGLRLYRIIIVVIVIENLERSLNYYMFVISVPKILVLKMVLHCY